MTEKTPLDAIGRDYARLAFGLERHVPGFIDAWLGPEAERAALAAETPPDPMELVRSAHALRERASKLDGQESRQRYLAAQVTAMETTARRLAGETVPYRDEVRLLLDIEPAATPEATYDAAIAELDRLLPGAGPVAPRMIAWRQGYAIAPEVARRLIDVVLPELRQRTRAMVDLPETETIEIQMVRDKPWSGYNWYLGGGRSRVELNTDLPIHAFRLTDLLAHEGYPGHHTEHTLKERLYTEQGLGEHALQLINTPECVISEGIATTAEEMLFTPQELVRFRQDVVYPIAGITADAERELTIVAATHALRSVAANAALLLHEEGQDPETVVAYLQRYGLSSEPEARQRLRFIADPLWRAYIFTYHAGYDLIAAWLDRASPAERRRRFRALLTEQIVPRVIG